MDAEALQSVLLSLANERSIDAVLKAIVESLEDLDTESIRCALASVGARVEQCDLDVRSPAEVAQPASAHRPRPDL